MKVIRVKWSLHAREEIVFELLQHLRGSAAKRLLEGITKSTRQMIEEQEAVRGRLFTVQDVMQSTVRAWLQVNITSCPVFDINFNHMSNPKRWNKWSHLFGFFVSHTIICSTSCTTSGVVQLYCENCNFLSHQKRWSRGSHFIRLFA